MKKPHVAIAVPTYDGTVYLATMKAIIQDTLEMLKLPGWRVSFQEVAGSADIYYARARLCHEFLETDGTHLMFVDSDVAWKPGSIPRLVKHGVDMVAAVYPRRTEPFSYNLQYASADNKLDMHSNGLCEVAGVSAGFMCISRNCLQKMTDAYRNDPIAGLANGPRGEQVSFFDPYRFKDDPKRKLGEDYAFCQRWRDLGGKVWIDVNMPMAHIGQKIYAANLGDHLKRAEQVDVSSAA
jgi:hypothetical protein